MKIGIAESVDLVVVGAGYHGLITASTYHQLHPTHKILIFDKYPTIGGVWASHRLYPGLKTNNMLGTYEYSDFPMNAANVGEGFTVQPGQHIPGEQVHQYLTRFARESGLWEFLRLGVEVKVCEKMEEDDRDGLTSEGKGWTLSVESRQGAESKIFTRKLVIATGLTSEPFVPTFPGEKEFTSPIIHCGNLLQQSDALFSTANNVVVFGGTKSAWDATYAFATRGIHVDWVIRKSGHGPCWMAPPYVTPLKKWLEKLVATRLLTWLSPCIWGDADGFTGIRSFFHGTAIGRAIVRGFWSVLGADVIALNGYDKHPETAKLKPWVDAFWVAAGLSILNYPTNFFDLVKEGKISVHIADIESLSGTTVNIVTSPESYKDNPPVDAHNTGTFALQADALICSTGWRYHPPMKFIDSTGKNLDSLLGLPHLPSAPVPSSEIEPDTSPLLQRADSEILSRFPDLKNQPKLNPALKPLPGADAVPTKEPEQFRLYRFMVPPSLIRDRSIAFNGMIQTICTTMVAQTQALWISAYLSGDPGTSFKETLNPLTRPKDEIEYETVLHARFGKWRYPGGYGARYPDFVFDAIPYMDLLLGDLGVQSRRKGGKTKREALEPYGPEDYTGLVEEFRGKGKAE